MILRVQALPLLLSLGSLVMANEKTETLFDFSGTEPAKGWQTVNDGVMGGVSEGKFKITDAKTMEFYGNLSLENNGGFTSVRTRPKDLDLAEGDALIVKVRGDGREYSLNLYVPTQRTAFSYRAAVKTKKDEWIEVRLPLKDFEATWFGRPVPDAGPVAAEQVNALGILLGDKKPGPFKLEVGWIKVQRTD
jgi:monofunctional biosynthetic peptidoglycan transglycosylase